VAPDGTLQVRPVQQSVASVHVAPWAWQAAAQVPPVQFPEQHWAPDWHPRPFGTQDTHFSPVSPLRHSALQQVASVAQVPPAAVQEDVCVPHFQTLLPVEVSRQVLGAQHERSSGPRHEPPAGVQAEPVERTQWSTPVAGSGTQGFPPQHWSLNWQTLVVVTLAGSAAGMQQAGSFASYPPTRQLPRLSYCLQQAPQSSFGHPPKQR
jgi:hypothetical protein